MQLPRFRVRTLMIAAAVVALALGAATGTVRRRAEFRKKATVYRTSEWKNGAYATVVGTPGVPDERSVYLNERSRMFAVAYPWPNTAKPDSVTRESRARRELFRRREKHYAALAKKYERAARWPFLPVFSDPPEPN